MQQRFDELSSKVLGVEVLCESYCVENRYVWAFASVAKARLHEATSRDRVTTHPSSDDVEILLPLCFCLEESDLSVKRAEIDIGEI